MKKPRSISLRIPNAILFILDRKSRSAPEPVDDSGIWADSNGITMSCMAPMDGETHITIGQMSDVGRAEHLLFDGQLNTPSREIVVETPYEAILQHDVQNARTHVRIWTDGSRWPEKVIVGVE
jgi:hypothetical protein